MMEEAIKRALAVKGKYEEELLRRWNVTGVAVGYKQVKGELTDQIAIIVYVRRKLPPREIPPEQFIPSFIEDVPTDVVEATFQALQVNRKSRIRPAVGGISVGHYMITAGTITNIFYDYETLKLKLVSNNHVIANSAPYRPAFVGDPIYQPGRYDGGTSEDTIAYLERWYDLRDYCVVDGGVGDPISQDAVSIQHLDFGEVKAPAVVPKIGDRILKGGRTTGLTEGRVVAVDASVRVYYGVATLTCVKQILALTTTLPTPFVRGGDSGSLAVLKNTSNPCGVVFAGSEDGTLGVLNLYSVFSDILKVGVPSFLEIRVQSPANKPLANAIVEVPALGTFSVTDKDGRVMFGNLETGKSYAIIALHPDYATKEIEVKIDEPKKTVIVKLEEKPPSPPLPPLYAAMLAGVSGLSAITAYGMTFTLFKPLLVEAFKSFKEVV